MAGASLNRSSLVCRIHLARVEPLRGEARSLAGERVGRL
jgi:hypothetical protein